MRIYIPIILPRLQFLHECAGLVFSTLYGLLQGLDDSIYFAFVLGFLGEDERIYRRRGIGLLVGRNRRIFCRGYVLAYRLRILRGFLLRIVVFVEVYYSKIIDVSYHTYNKKVWACGTTNKAANLW